MTERDDIYYAAQDAIDALNDGDIDDVLDELLTIRDLSHRDNEWEKKSDLTYRNYRSHVETAAQVAVDAMEGNDGWVPEEEEYQAVEYAIQGSTMFTNRGLMLMTVLLSDQDPDMPDYEESWTSFVDPSSDPTWTDCVSEMARVCYYSDVFDRFKRLREDDDD